MATLKRLGDKVLGRLVRAEDAGACTVNYRNPCGCYPGPNYYQYLVDCNGVCRRSQYTCI